VRVIFMGTPEFAVPSLERLAVEHEVVAAYVRPDAVSGRGGVARPAVVKSAALRLGLPVRQPVTLRDPAVVRELAEFSADVICVAAYGLILPADVLDAARLGAINVHASLLPRWRGAAPIQRAILAGDPLLGVSIMRMEEGLDTGPYCLQGSLPAGQKGAVTLTAELGALGAELLAAALPRIADGTAVWTAQAEEDVTYAAKVTKDDVTLDPTLSAAENVLRIRASVPASPARLLVAGRGVTVLSASEVSDASFRLQTGAIRQHDDGIAFAASPGMFVARRIKPDGKAEMDAAAWARGARLAEDAVWERAR
jgi:methionyl-tRNA formyltransferase